jgi:hypothetical protein
MNFLYIKIFFVLEQQQHTRKTWFALSLNILSSGESTGVCLVNLISNWLTSSSPLRTGLCGGSYRLAYTSSQFRWRKNEWFYKKNFV